MIDNILQIVAPHHCYGCQKTGSPLCDNCKYDIVDEPFDGCVVCARPTRDGICKGCQTSYEKAWCVGDRSGTLERLIDAYKFERVRAAATPLAALLSERLPVLPDKTIVVPVPTVPSHIRQRGYDHTLLLARMFAKRRGLRVESLLSRSDRSVQRDQNKRRRFEQAESAYVCNAMLDSLAPYLLVDDVITTNATVRYAAAVLRRSGAEHVWVAALARQPLDK